mgnify:FL=1
MEGASEMTVHRRLICILLVALTVMMSGCTDLKALERLAHVVVVGLDAAGDGYLEITFQIANPQVGSTDIGQAEGEPPSDISSLTAPDRLTAR